MNSGKLSSHLTLLGPDWKHFRYTIGGLAAVDARVIFYKEDRDGNGVLCEKEVDLWNEMFVSYLTEKGFQPSENQQEAMEAVWRDAQS